MSDFIHQITSQSIFSLFTQSKRKESCKQQLNKLAVRNQDLFFVSNNVVRCCKINPYTTNYRLLNTMGQQYEIHSLSLNQSGTLLAIIGSNQIDVVDLPNTITHEDAVFINKSSYKISNIEGEIKKVIWQSIAAKDCNLVILNDRNNIKVYDISKSLSVPEVNLSLNELNGDITSISFGSSKNLIGGMSLYISTDQGCIYTIFPFIDGFSKIATTESAIDIALADTKTTMEMIQERFPSNLMDTASSMINRKVLKQFDFFESIKSRVDSGLFTTEVRDFKNPYELLVLEHNCSFNTYDVQGPLIQCNESIQDLTYFHDNELVSVLVSVGEESTVNYFAQLNPLLMNFERYKKPNSSTTYVKPRKGFGFISTLDTLEEQKTFWKNELSVLDLLQSDRLDVNSGRSYLVKMNDKLAVIINDTFVLIDDSWIDLLVESLFTDDPQLDINTNYDIVSSHPEQIKGWGYIKDEISLTGEYLIILRDKDVDDLEVITIKNNVVEPSEIKLIEYPIEKNPQQVLISKPFEELEIEIEKLKNLKLSNSNGELNGSIESLENVNKLSNETNKYISQYTIYGMKLQSRITSQLELLKSQIDKINTIKNHEFSQEQLDLVKKLSTKHDTLTERLNSLQEKIYKSLVDIHSNQTLPLSKFEKKWMNEINVMIEQISKGDNNLTKRVINLTSQVDAIKKNEIQVDELEELKLQKRLQKIINWLKLEDKAINELKSSLKNLNTKIK